MNNIQEVESKTPPQFWPEDIRRSPRQDKFPWKTVITALLPGGLAIVLLFIPFIWLRDQANQNVVYVDQNGQMHSVQANVDKVQSIGLPPLQLDPSTQAEVEGVLPVLAWPEWSPDGRKLAATINANNNVQVVVFNSISETTTVLGSTINSNHKVVFPGNGWSPDNTHLALLETDNDRAYLSLVDLSQAELAILPLSLSFDALGGLDWRPPVNGNEFLVTTLPDGSTPSTLHIVDAETGQSRPFIPQDRQLLRANAIWSPDGESIAYIVREPGAVQENGPYSGALWVAKSDGTDARELVSDELNMSPIWPKTDPAFIYFSRPITGTNTPRYGLYKVHIGGGTEPVMVGESYETFLSYPFDQKHFLEVASDGRSLSLSDTPTPSTNQFGWTPDTVIRAAIQQSLPTLGASIWSPDGRFLAITNWHNGKVVPTIYNASLQHAGSFGSNFDVMAVPGSGWSHDSSTLALVESDGTNAYLTLVSEPFGGENATVYDFILDTRAGLNWHPLEPKLLITGYTADNPTPSLYVLTPGLRSPQPLLPSEGRAVHGDAAWSPDGSQIAYIATDVYTSGQDILPGELWLADANGGRPRSLLSEPQAIAPMWNETGDTIYYIKVDGELGPFALYRRAVDGSSPPVYVGPVSEQVALLPFDRNRLLQWSADGRQLLFAGEPPVPPDHYVANALESQKIAQIHANIPFKGMPAWSPDGNQFAGTIFDGDNVLAAIYKSQTAPPILSPPTTDWIVTPADGWSSDSDYLALLRHDGSTTRLAVMDTVQSGLSTAFPLDTRAGLSWRPGVPQIMVTSLAEGITPTLRILNVIDNSTMDFTPEDGQAVHADGVWSPNGAMVAYITQETITPTLEMEFLAGALWIADGTGRNPRLLVPDGLNFAPIWDISENRILFSRYLTETDSFAIYQVSLDRSGSPAENGEGTLMSYYGPGSSAFAKFPFDRQSFLRWSPEGIRWLLPGASQTSSFVYYRLNKDNIVSLLPANCGTIAPYFVSWAPTNRGVLVACPSAQMFLHWTDSQRTNKPYPDGLYPSWQP